MPRLRVSAVVQYPSKLELCPDILKVLVRSLSGRTPPALIASRHFAADNRCHVGQKLQGRLAVGIIKGKGPFEPGCNFGVHTSVVLDGSQLDPLEKRRRDADMDCEAVLGWHDRDLWRKGFEAEIGALCAIYVPLGAISYPQANKPIVTDRDIPLSKVKAGWTHE